MTAPHEVAADLLEQASRVVVLTGAGMSAESGVPTFREAQTGLWARFNPEELATERAFRENPARVFGWYLHRLRAVRAAEPHAGYRALVHLDQRFRDGFCIVTQNVDGFHARAGSRDIVELHGSLEAFRCIECQLPFSVEQIEGLDDVQAEMPPPTCHECGNLVRPGVVWFGESLPSAAIGRAWRAAEQADVALVVGTSSLVYPAANLPAVVSGRGGRVIEINPDETPLSPSADLYWGACAGEALPLLVEVLAGAQERR
jgi:NAD-dependent deacetylase